MMKGRNGRGRRQKKKGFGDITITDSVRIGVDLALKNFRVQEEETELEFPTSLGRLERAYVHKIAAEFGFKSKSRGQGQSRYITVYKNEGSSIVRQDAVLSLTKISEGIISELIGKYPVSKTERAEILPITDRSLNIKGRDLISVTKTKLGSGVPRVPDSWGGKSLVHRRKDLPIWEYRLNILEVIQKNQVVLVTGDTGSGKTTQVPQFILEDAFCNQKPVRVVVCEPRRLAATTVAERVAQERDEQLGQTVGYQIRLDSCTSNKNLLTFCTYGVLLRSLMSGDYLTQSVTHIIVDEVHERDKLSDFLLTVLKDLLERHPNLKLILMSATVDSQQFLSFFPGCTQVSVPGRMFPVEEFFLEDVLSLVKYGVKGSSAPNQTGRSGVKNTGGSQFKPSSGLRVDNDDVVVEVSEPEVDRELDDLLTSCFLDGNPDSLGELSAVLEMDESKVNYQHSEKGVTVLMVAAAWGAIDLLQFTIGLGAHLHKKAANGWTALNFAKSTNQTESMKVLENQLAQLDDFHNQEDDLLPSRSMTDEQKKLLENYQNSFDDDDIDHSLIVDVLVNINKQPEGAVLVFLPGYEDMMITKEMIQEEGQLKHTTVLMLHSQMATSEHKKAFEPCKHGKRKIILSTNIAETGITLNDVIYVVDSGKAKELSFDALTNSSMLKTDWISQSSATQRKGRAGRCQPGKVYRLFSSTRYYHLSPYQTPEILRTPLLELCLQTKLLAPPNTPIADFLARVPEPPAFLVTRNAVQSLKTLEALDQWEEVTPLGSHLLEIPLDPVLGKILLLGVVLKCLDPVLTICCSLAYRDPFLIPSDSRSKRTSDQTRRRLAGNTFSDHHTLLNTFLEWDSARQAGKVQSWCKKNNVSFSTMEMIAGMKSQVLNHLKDSGFVKVRSGGYPTNSYNQYNINSSNWSMVKACLVAGLYPNIARYDHEAGQLRTNRECKVKIHPSSVCAHLNQQIKKGGLPSEWMIFTEMTRVGRTAYVRGVSFVSPACVALLCGPSRLPIAVWEAGERTDQFNYFLEESSDSEEEDQCPNNSVILNLDPWIALRSNIDSAQKLLQLRQKWTALWFRKLNPHYKCQDEMDDRIIANVGEALKSEDEFLGLFSNQLNEFRSPLAENLDKVSLEDSPKPEESKGPGRYPTPPTTTPNYQQRRSGPQTSYLIVRPSPGSVIALEAAKSHGKTAVWSFAPSVERKLTTELAKGGSVVVFFNASCTQLIQGCAVLSGVTVREGNRIGQKIEWIGKQSLDITHLQSIVGHIDLQQGKDVFEIPPDVALPIIYRMTTMEPRYGYGRSNDWNRGAKYYRRN